MIQTLYRQRRRSLVCASLFTLTALIGTMTEGRMLAHMPIWAPGVATVLFFGICGLGVAGLVLACRPIRRLWEVIALFTLQETLFIWILRDANTALSNPLLRLAIAATVIALLYLALYGRLLDQVPALFAFGARDKIMISAPPEAVWREIAPMPTPRPGTSQTEQIQVPPPQETRGADVPPANDSSAPRLPLWDQPSETTTIILLERPWRCRFAVKLEAQSPGRAAGIYDIRLRPCPAGVVLEIGLYQTGIPLGEVLRLWLDDVLGVEIDALKSRVEAQACPETGPATVPPPLAA